MSITGLKPVIDRVFDREKNVAILTSFFSHSDRRHAIAPDSADTYGKPAAVHAPNNV
jgi:hypothetical protein